MAVTFTACYRMDFDVVSVNIVIMLRLLMVTRSIVSVVVFLMLFVLPKAFAILVKCLPFVI